MSIDQTVFTQIMEHLPIHHFRKCVNRYQGHRKVKSFTCMEQFLCLAFAQLTYRESLRDIEACLRAVQPKLYHMGIRSRVSRSTLADANEKRDWRIYADFAQILIAIAKPLYSQDDFGVELDNTVYALDASTIDLCLSLFPWARFRETKGAIKLHTLTNLRGNIPEFIHFSDGKMHEVKVLDILIPEPGSIYVMDRGYVDYASLLPSSSFSLLCYSRQKQFCFSTALFLCGRQVYRAPMRPNNCLEKFLRQKRLPGKASAHYLSRYRDWKKVCFFDQQFHLTFYHDIPVIQGKVADRAVFQMDQAEPTYKGLLWDLVELGQNTNLDCHIRLRPCCYPQEEAWPGAKPLHNSTDFNYHSFRENPHFTGLPGGRLQKAREGFR